MQLCDVVSEPRYYFYCRFQESGPYTVESSSWMWKLKSFGSPQKNQGPKAKNISLHI